MVLMQDKVLDDSEVHGALEDPSTKAIGRKFPESPGNEIQPSIADQDEVKVEARVAAIQ